MASEVENAELKDTLSILQSLLNSTKDDLSIYNLDKDFIELEGKPIPFRKFGHGTLIDFFKAHPKAFEVYMARGTIYVRAALNEANRHIKELVIGQKSSKSKGIQRANVRRTVSRWTPPSHRIRPRYGSNPPRSYGSNPPHSYSSTRFPPTRFSSRPPYMSSTPRPLLSLNNPHPGPGLLDNPWQPRPSAPSRFSSVASKNSAPRSAFQNMAISAVKSAVLSNDRAESVAYKAGTLTKTIPNNSATSTTQSKSISNGYQSRNSSSLPQSNNSMQSNSNNYNSRLQSNTTLVNSTSGQVGKYLNITPAGAEISANTRSKSTEVTQYSAPLPEVKLKPLMSAPEVKIKPLISVPTEPPIKKEVDLRETLNKIYAEKTQARNQVQQNQALENREANLSAHERNILATAYGKTDKITNYACFKSSDSNDVISNPKNIDSIASNAKMDLEMERRLKIADDSEIQGPLSQKSYKEKLIPDGSYKTTLQIEVKKRSITPELKFQTMKIGNKKYNTNYICKVSFGDKIFSSYPNEQPTTEKAEELASKLALDHLEVDVHYPVTSDFGKSIERVRNILPENKEKVWWEHVLKKYKDFYRECLQKDWVEKVQRIHGIGIEFDKATDFWTLNRTAKENLQPIPSIQGVDFSNQLDVYVSHFGDCSDVYFRLVGDESDAYHDMATNLETEYENKSRLVPFYNLKENEICLCDSHDEGLFRVRIVQVKDNGTVDVFFIDHGGVENVNDSDLFLLENRYRKLPAQALQCCLAGFEMGSNLFDTGLLIDARKLLVGRSLIADVLSEGKVLSVVLYDTSNDDDPDFNINKHLLQKYPQDAETTALPKEGGIGEVYVTHIENDGDIHVRIETATYKQLEEMLQEARDVAREIYNRDVKTSELNAEGLYLDKFSENGEWNQSAPRSSMQKDGQAAEKYTLLEEQSIPPPSAWL